MAVLRIFLAGWLYVATTFLPVAAHADDSLQLAEQEIKAGLLYNFLKYTQWPPASMERLPKIIVCIFGDDPFGGYLQPMSGRTVNQREITIHSVHDISDALNCHLLFINASEKDSWPQLHNFLKGKPVLTVSDFSGFATSGGMIEFGRKDSHINVEFNAQAAAAAQLQVQDRLLRLVTVVHPASIEGGR